MYWGIFSVFRQILIIIYIERKGSLANTIFVILFFEMALLNFNHSNIKRLIYSRALQSTQFLDEVLYFHCWWKADLISVWKKEHAMKWLLIYRRD